MWYSTDALLLTSFISAFFCFVIYFIDFWSTIYWAKRVSVRDQFPCSSTSKSEVNKICQTCPEFWRPNNFPMVSVEYFRLLRCTNSFHCFLASSLQEEPDQAVSDLQPHAGWNQSHLPRRTVPGWHFQDYQSWRRWLLEEIFWRKVSFLSSWHLAIFTALSWCSPFLVDQDLILW